MKFNSIRWRLPASYAGIALLAALSLGSVMLLVLSGYYARQERDYLLGNAEALRPLVEDSLAAGVPLDSLQDTVNGLAFFSQARIRVLDSTGAPVVDSGVPQSDQLLAISGGTMDTVVFSMPTGPAIQTGVVSSYVEGELLPCDPLPGGTAVAAEPDAIFMVSASPLGYGFTTVAPSAPSDADPARRSRQLVSLPLRGSLGTLEFSAGPAYGLDIIRSVSLAWAGAGVVAILLAALAGWGASRQVTRPVLALTTATQRMQAGDLSTRVRLPEKRPAAEFRALADSFNGMAGRVESTISTLRVFIADAAHELNTPLTALKTDLELAAETGDPAHVALARPQVDRLHDLVSGLLDLSRLESGIASGQAAVLDLGQLLQRLSEGYAARAEQSDLAFDLELPGSPVRVPGQELQLSQAVGNLVDNAIKFTPAGGRVRLVLQVDGGRAVVRVEDTGIGIPAEDLAVIFQRFHRGRNASAYPGNGLGLAIVRTIVDQHRGTIEVESDPSGTRFTIFLPLA